MFWSIRCILPVLMTLSVVGCGAKEPSRAQQIAELAPSLNDPDPKVQGQTLMKLAGFGRDAESVAPAVLELLKSKHKDVRWYAALAVTSIAKPEDAVAALTEALKDPDANVRRQAAFGLGELDPAAQSALPALEKVSKEPGSCNPAKTAIQRIRKS